MGYSLFERRTGGYVLSDPGRSILDDAKAMEAASLSIRDRPMLQDGPAGRLRLTTIRSLADIVLAPHLGELSAQFPGVRLEIVTDIRVQSLVQREADIALRLGHPKDCELTGRRVATTYALQAVGHAVGRGHSARVIGYDIDSEGVAEARWLESRFDRAAFGIRSSSNAVQASAAAADLASPCCRASSRGNIRRLPKSPVTSRCRIANYGCCRRQASSTYRGSGPHRTGLRPRSKRSPLYFEGPCRS